VRFPVSFAQERLWRLDQLGPACHRPYVVWLDGQVDLTALQHAMDAMVARHAVLRTGIVATDGRPEQVVADTASLPVHRIPFDGTESSAESIVAELAARPFDLASPPLARAVLIVDGGERSVFVLVPHEIIADRATVAILFAEMSTVYSIGTLAPLWMDYPDYAVWQRDRLRGEELSRQLAYWREKLDGSPALLPEHPPTHQGARVNAAIPPHLADEAVTVLAGYAVVLSRFARQADLVIGVQVTGRIRVELEPVAGPFADVVPVRVSLAADPTFAELLDRLRDATVAGGELPFDMLAEELRLGATTPLFAHQSLAGPVLDLPGVVARGEVLRTGTAMAGLTLFADGTELVLEYRTDVLDAPFATRFVRSVATVAEHAAAAPDTPVADLPLPTLVGTS
jgi:hypothetical protein